MVAHELVNPGVLELVPWSRHLQSPESVLLGMQISGLSISLIVHPSIFPLGWSFFPTRSSETLSGTGGGDWSYRDPVMLFKVYLCKLRLYLMSFSTKCLSSNKYVSNGVGLLTGIKHLNQDPTYSVYRGQGYPFRLSWTWGTFIHGPQF